MLEAAAMWRRRATHTPAKGPFPSQLPSIIVSEERGERYAETSLNLVGWGIGDPTGGVLNVILTDLS